MAHAFQPAYRAATTVFGADVERWATQAARQWHDRQTFLIYAACFLFVMAMANLAVQPGNTSAVFSQSAAVMALVLTLLLVFEELRRHRRASAPILLPALPRIAGAEAAYDLLRAAADHLWWFDGNRAGLPASDLADHPAAITLLSADRELRQSCLAQPMLTPGLEPVLTIIRPTAARHAQDVRATPFALASQSSIKAAGGQPATVGKNKHLVMISRSKTVFAAPRDWFECAIAEQFPLECRTSHDARNRRAAAAIYDAWQALPETIQAAKLRAAAEQIYNNDRPVHVPELFSRNDRWFRSILDCETKPMQELLARWQAQAGH